MAIGQIRALPVLPTQPQPQAQSQPQPAQPTSTPSPIPTPSPSPRPYPRPLPNLPTPTNSSNPLPDLPNTTPNLPPPDRVLSPAPTTSSSISSASAYHSGHEHGASSVSDLSYFRDKDTTEHGEIVPGPGSDAVFGSGSGSGKEGGVPQVKVHEPATSPTTNTNTSASSTASTSVSTTTTTTATPSSPSPTQTGSPSLVSRLGKKKRQLSRDLLRLPSPAPALPSTIPIGDFPQMIAQHHMQTMGLHSPPPSSSSSGWKDKDPQTPTRPGRLNLGMFSSRARKESASASASSSAGGVGGRRPSTPSASMLDMGVRSDVSRNAGEGFGFGDTHDGDGSLKRRGSGSASGSPSTHAGLTALFNGGRVSPHSPASSTLASPAQNQPGSSQPKMAASPKIKAKPITPPKPSKFKAGNILGTALGMGVGGRGSVGIMPSSPSIAAALEYMRHEHDRDPRGSFSARRAIGAGKTSMESRDGGSSVGKSSLECSQSSVESASAVEGGSEGKSSLESAVARVGYDEDGEGKMGCEMEDLGAETSSGPSSSVGSLSVSVTSSGTSGTGSEVIGWRDDVMDGFPPVPGQGGMGAAFQHPNSQFVGSSFGSAFNGNSNFHAAMANSNTSTSNYTSPDSNPQARPQPPTSQDPDKRVSTASSQRTLTALNSKRESGIFVFPGIEGVVRLEGGTPLARMHTTDGLSQAGFARPPGGQERHSGGYERYSGIYDGQMGALNSQPDAPDPDKGKFDAPIPRPARLGQLAGSLKRRSASMSILLPPARVPPPESESASSEASSPRFAPPPLPPRRAPIMPDGAVTDSEGSHAGRRWGRPAGIKGKIAAWTAAAEGNGRRKHPRVGGSGTAHLEPRRSDSPQQPQAFPHGQNQGYPYSHSPASAPALQVHTHVHLPSHVAHSQTPLMTIAALAPAARDLALGVGKRVEKFYRARSTSGAGGEPHPAMAMRVGSPGMSIGVGSEPVLPPPLRPAMPGASGLVFGRPLDDPGALRDAEGWVDEGLGVRRCVGLPVLVSRCVRHLEKWGGDEEGLFRISGRHSHISRLRAEFDAGADYELSEIQPSDLDPHAVSTLFKAYLRELPDPILTRALKHQFDLAMTKTDNSSNASFDLSKLPTSMTSFGESSENMRSVDASLLTDIKVLVDQLPQVNYNLLHELCHLLRYTTQHAHTTKMPLGNLLLLFCPTLSFSPGFLRCLVEGQDALFEWGRQAPPTPTLPAVPTIQPAAASSGQPPAAPPALPPRTVKISDATTTTASKHAASSSLAPASLRSLKSPLNVSTDTAQPRSRSQTTTSSGPPSRASMFFPNLGPRRPSITMLFGGGSRRDSIDGNQTPRHSSSSGDSSGMSDEELHVNPKRQTRPPRVSLDIPDGSFSPSLSPPKARVGVSQPEPSPTKRSCQTPIADLFKSQLTAAVPTTAPSAVTVTGTSANASPGDRSSPNKTMPPRLGLPFREPDESVDEMGWSRGVIDAASASLGPTGGQR